jgi:hypothetical protein
MKRALMLVIAGAFAPARAADLAPSPAAITRAAAEGAALAPRREGYALKDHVIYAVRDARAIDPADGAVDAVVLATPLERTRHAAYIAAYGGGRISGAEAYRRAALPPGQLAVIIFAHGRDHDDEVFDGATIEAAPVAGAPAEKVYPLAPANRERMAGTVTYRFDLGAVRDAGRKQTRLRFIDATGKAFDLPIDLGRFG